MAKTRKEPKAPVSKTPAKPKPLDKNKGKTTVPGTPAESKPVASHESKAPTAEPPVASKAVAKLEPKMPVLDTPAESKPVENAVPQAPAPQTPPEPKPLEMPRGAMLVMRVSGGLHFTTQEMVVYPDGRVTAGAGDTAKESYNRAQRSMADAHVVRLRRMLDTSGFYDLPQAKGEQSPDGYAYEIFARVGSKHNHIEVFTGTMPPGIQLLVDFLMKWLPAEDTA